MVVLDPRLLDPDPDRSVPLDDDGSFSSEMFAIGLFEMRRGSLMRPDPELERGCEAAAATSSVDEPEPERRRDGSVNTLAGGRPLRLFNLAI